MSKPRKFHKKPVAVEAMCLYRSGENIVREWIENNGGECMSWRPGNSGMFEGLLISTPEGQAAARYGDWIIRGAMGEFYPCKPDIFEESYEPAD